MTTKKLGFGLMRLPLLDPNDQKSIDMEQLKKMVDLFLDRGFTYFDTAYMYHDFASERAVKTALVERHARDCFTLTSKLPTMMLKTKEDQARIFNEQLEKCGVEYFDYYLLHALTKVTYETAQRLGSFDFIQQKKKEGKVRHIGISFHDSAELLEEILSAHPEIELVQIQLNYLDWDNEVIQSRQCYETIRRHGKEVLVMEPIKGGTLAKVPQRAAELLKGAEPDKSIPSWAIRFAASHEGVKMVLSGMSTLAQLDDNTSYMQDFTPFTPAEYDLVKKVVGIINEAITVPCTACHYCTKGCPKHIAIPEFFSIYNNHCQAPMEGFSTQKFYYDTLIDHGSGKASACIGCKQCERMCPQHIEITKYLRDVAKTFEA